MKKLFMLLPLAAFMFASCSSDKDEQIVNAPEAQIQKVPEGAIWFTSGIQELTRATTTMDDFSAFKVTGVHSNADFAFANLPVTKSGSLWTYNPTEDADSWKYWPNDNSDIQFYAFAPSSGANDLTDKVEITSLQQVMTGFTQKQKVAEQVDVLAAYASGNKTANASSGVSLDFKHALAQIEVRAKNSASNEYKVEVLGVKICRVKNAGDMTFQALADDYPTWGNLSGSKSYIVEGTTALEMTSSVQNIMFGTDNFLMVPQQLTGWTGSETDETGAYISVLCRISQKSGETWVQRFPDTEGLYSFSSVPISTNWTAGHKYVYTLDFFGAGAGAGQYDPEPTNPETVEGGSDDPNAPQSDDNVDDNPTGVDPTDPQPDDPQPGDPIIPEAKASIKFTVSITDWINGAGDNEKLDL